MRRQRECKMFKLFPGWSRFSSQIVLFFSPKTAPRMSHSTGWQRLWATIDRIVNDVSGFSTVSSISASLCPHTRSGKRMNVYVIGTRRARVSLLKKKANLLVSGFTSRSTGRAASG